MYLSFHYSAANISGQQAEPEASRQKFPSHDAASPAWWFTHKGSQA